LSTRLCYAAFMSDFDEALEKAKAGSVVSQGYVGWCYLYGRETDASYSEALYWLSAAAYRGRASRPFVHLGDMYAAGLGLQPNMGEAVRHYKAVVAVELRAQLALARIYAKGDGTTADPDEALRLYSSLSDCNHIHDDPAIAAFAGALTSAEVEEAKAHTET
jgi:TPR repeat protein